jgi:alpha-N-arabinofuranosidase
VPRIASAINASRTVKVTTLASADLNGENSFEHPKAISPETSTAEVKSGTLSVHLRPLAFCTRNDA